MELKFDGNWGCVILMLVLAIAALAFAWDNLFGCVLIGWLL